MSTSAMNWPPRPDEDSLFVSPRAPDQAVTSQRPRLLGRVAVMAMLVLAVQGGIFWQLHRSSAAKRQQVALEMQDFEMRAQALRSEMAALQGRLGQARGEIDQFQATRSITGATPSITGAGGVTPSKPARPTSARERPSKPGQASVQAATRPAPIVLSARCTSTPLGC